MRCDILQSACRLAALIFCCALLTVRESDSTYVPGRCVCPRTQNRVRGILKGLMVIPKNPICGQVTVIVDLKNGRKVCVNPEAPLGKHLIHCWKRSTRMNRDVRNCLRRKRRIGLQNPPTQQSGQKREPRSLPALS